MLMSFVFFFQAEDGIRDGHVTGVQTCALPILCLFACNAFAQSADWQKTWDETLAAAKKEGKIVVVGSPDPVMRKEIIPKFTERFGITVEFIAGQSGQIAARVRTERLS